MVLLSVVLVFCTYATQLADSGRPQLGTYPLQGRLYRVKHVKENNARASIQFLYYLNSNRARMNRSVVSNVTYYIPSTNAPYPGFESDDMLCLWRWPITSSNVFDDANSTRCKGQRAMIVYYLCDEYCCGDECCEPDTIMTFFSLCLIALFALLPVGCVAVCLGAFKKEAAREASATEPTNVPVQRNTFQVAFHAQMRREQEQREQKQATVAEVNPAEPNAESPSASKNSQNEQSSQLVEL